MLHKIHTNAHPLWHFGCYVFPLTVIFQIGSLVKPKPQISEKACPCLINTYFLQCPKTAEDISQDTRVSIS